MARYATELPFRVPTDTTRVGPGSTVALALFATPRSYEPIVGVLVLEVDGVRHPIELVLTVDRDLDDDGDDAPAAGGSDCDDRDPDRYTGATERCDGIDQDCDGRVDLDPEPRWWPDADLDGFGDALATPATGCDAPAGSVSNDGDCDDADPARSPDAAEIWYDGTDQDCDGNDADQDLDGVPLGPDCDDLDPAISPAAPEIDDGRDQDCDALVDEGLWSRGTLLLTELMSSPHAALDTEGRYVEIYNPTDGDVLLSELVVTVGTQVRSLLTAPSLGPGALAVLCSNTDPTLNGGVGCTAQVSWIGNARTIRLTAGGLDVDEIVWDAWTPATSGVARELGLGTLDPDANDLEASWCDAIDVYGLGDRGTPGMLVPPCP